MKKPDVCLEEKNKEKNCQEEISILVKKVCNWSIYL